MLKSLSESQLETVQENRRREVIPTRKDLQRNLTKQAFSKLTNLHLVVEDRIDRLITLANRVQKYKRDLLTCPLQPQINLVVQIQLDTVIHRLLAKFNQTKETDRLLLNITAKHNLKVPRVLSTKRSPYITKLQTSLSQTT